MYHTKDYGENRVTKPYGTNNFFSYHFLGMDFLVLIQIVSLRSEASWWCLKMLAVISG